jgi:hypothetical protein
VPKPDQLSNALKGMGVRAGQRLQLDEPAPAPVALVTAPAPESESASASESAAPNDVESRPENSSMVAPAEPKRRGKKSHEQAQQATLAKHMGTIETPYVRQRDNTPTRKVSVILPIDLARELQIFCVQTGQRTNTFHEEALRTALARAKSRGASR